MEPSRRPLVAATAVVLLLGTVIGFRLDPGPLPGTDTRAAGALPAAAAEPPFVQDALLPPRAGASVPAPPVGLVDTAEGAPSATTTSERTADSAAEPSDARTGRPTTASVATDPGSPSPVARPRATEATTSYTATGNGSAASTDGRRGTTTVSRAGAHDRVADRPSRPGRASRSSAHRSRSEARTGRRSSRRDHAAHERRDRGHRHPHHRHRHGAHR